MFWETQTARRNDPRSSAHAICTFCSKCMRARAVKWKWRESANMINENSHVTPYVLHFPDATWDRFLQSRVRGTCRCVVWHVLRCVADNETLPVPFIFVAATISHTTMT